MNKNYRALSVLSILMTLFGLFFISIGIYFALYEGMVEPRVAGHPFRNRDFLELSAGLLSLFFGFVALLVSQCIKVLLDIEENTRRLEESIRLLERTSPPRGDTKRDKAQEV